MFFRVSRRTLHPSRVFLVLLLALSACGGGGAESTGQLPPPSVRTLAYVVTECREDARSYTGRQSVRVQRGTDAAVIVADTGVVLQEPPGLPGTCRLFGEGRAGLFSVLGGAFQRLAVSPDGSGVVFEVTSRFSIIRFRPSMPEAGFYFVRADGSGLRRLGSPSREALFRFVLDTSAPIGFRTNLDTTAITFTADGRKVVFFDRGPGPDDADTQQLVSLDVTTGERFQVTHLPAPPPLPRDALPTYNPLLRLDGTISFRTFTNPNGLNPGGSNQVFTVEPDGTDLKRVPIPVVLPGGIDPNFQITSAQPTSLRLSLPDGTSEIFFSDHNNLLQLTNFGLSDTIPGTVELDGQRVFFGASADPFGTNRTRNCQIFSIDRNATDLHQVTQFGQDVPSAIGCGLLGTGAPPGCAFIFIVQDPATGALLFYSSCDPFGTNPYGDQLFVMYPDGTDLRQLTDARGFMTEADSTVMAELPGPFASTAVRR